MRLDELTAGLASEAGGDLGPAGEGASPAGGGTNPASAAAEEVEITGLSYDSRAVGGGELFFCVSGFQRDGHEFAAQALAAGAAALVVERRLGLGVPEVLVRSVRASMAPIAARFYGDPTAELSVVGVTGTNGKTTTAYLVRALSEARGEQCGLLGTVTSIAGGRERDVVRTTPEAIDLQAEFRAMLDGGDRACAIEVSSHALELGRVDATHFAAAIFTNLTQDHLDFHDTMEDYFLAKRRLFAEHRPGVSVINGGDPYGARLAQEIDGAVTFAVQPPGGAEGARGPDVVADYAARELRCDVAGCSFRLHTPSGECDVRLPMPGRFNVANALGALAAVHSLGGELDALVAALERGVRVPGRFEPVEEGQDFAVLVDYAHTPDSLENVLESARALIDSRAGDAAAGQPGDQDGRVLCVFGAGGDRDRGKRPLMGEIAARLADVTFVTSDNPRSEDPEQIIAEIMAGVARVPERRLVRSVADRAIAIDEAIGSARPGDVLVIAGKGHEQGQELAGGRKVPFDDVAVARKALRLHRGRA
jgi:UDP-N-acetylmuramoyl-L-alanyl-D-glutamate--2,6-diaminopimelate ligase